MSWRQGEEEESVWLLWKMIFALAAEAPGGAAGSALRVG